MKKRLISWMLCMAMMLGSMTALAYEDVTLPYSRAAVTLLEGMGIMEPEDNTSFGAQEPVTRGQFAVYTMKMMNMVPAPAQGAYFSDVDGSTTEGGAINFLVGMNVIPRKQTEYHPSQAIAYEEALEMMMNCLGYQRTPGETTFLNDLRASALGTLCKSIQLKNTDGMNKGATALLLYNALFTEVVEFTAGNANSPVYERTGKTLLEQRWDMFETSGVVMGYEDTYIGAEKSLGENNVEINGTVYDMGNTNLRPYLGYQVKIYYHEGKGGEETIIAFTERDGANAVTVADARDLEVNGNRVSYYAPDTGRKKSISMVDSPAVMYNGRYEASYQDLEEILNIKEGTVTFLSNDSTNKVNVILVNEVQHLLVERIDQKGQRLYLKNNSDILKSPVGLDLYKNEIDYLNIYMDGKEISFEELAANDAVTMVKSKDGKKVDLTVSRKTVEGTISSIKEDGEKVVIDGTTYQVSSYNTDQFHSGDYGVYALSTDGKVVGHIKVQGGDDSYAYLMKVMKDTGSETVTLKVFTASGETRILDCASSVVVNAKKTEPISLDKALQEVPGLVTLRLNAAGEVREINNPYDATTNLSYVDESRFIKQWRKTSVRYIDGILGRSLVTDDTVIFHVPTRKDNNNDYDYQILTKEEMTNRTYSDVVCYDLDRNGRIGALVIKENVSKTVPMSNSLFFVSEINKAWNPETGEDITLVKGFENGEEKELNFVDTTISVTYEDGWMDHESPGEEIFDQGYLSLNCGDALQYTLNPEGNVLAYRLVFNNEQTIYTGPYLTYLDPKNFFERWSDVGSVKDDFYDNLYLGFGDVQNRYADYMVLLALNEADRNKYANSDADILTYYRPINLKNAAVYIYNVNKKELTLGDMESVSQGDVVFVRSKNMGQLNEVMVYSEE